MIALSWDNDEQTIIRGEFQKGWTIQNLIDAINEIYELVDSVEHEVYIIFDLLNASNVPSGGISNFKTLAARFHPRIKMVIDVSNSMLVETLTNIFKSLHQEGTRVHVVRTFEEAYTLIERDIQSSITDL